MLLQVKSSGVIRTGLDRDSELMSTAFSEIKLVHSHVLCGPKVKLLERQKRAFCLRAISHTLFKIFCGKECRACLGVSLQDLGIEAAIDLGT